MRKIVYGVILLLIGIIFSGCAMQHVTYNTEKKILSLKIDDKKRKELQLTNPKYSSNIRNCVENHFTIFENNISTYGTIFVEHIKISSDCYWNGLAEGYFINFIKKTFKTNKLERISNSKIGNYEFSTFLAEDNIEISLVELWGSNENTFILDKKGIFTKELKSELESNNN